MYIYIYVMCLDVIAETLSLSPTGSGRGMPFYPRTPDVEYVLEKT
jgi:hypothetical protein